MKESNEPDEELVVMWIQRARNRNRTAFDQLVERYWKRVYGQCDRFLRNSEEAEDATQETFVRAWEKLPTLCDDRAFVFWLLKIAQYLCLGKLRNKASQAKNRTPISLDDPDNQGLIDKITSLFNGLEQVELSILAERIRLMIRAEALQKRPHRPRWDRQDLQIFEMYYLHGLTEEQIAEELSWKRGRVHYRLTTRIQPVLLAVGNLLQAELKQI